MSQEKKVLFNGPVLRVEQSDLGVHLKDQWGNGGITAHTPTSELRDALRVFISSVEGEDMEIARKARIEDEFTPEDNEIVMRANYLAREFYAMQGYCAKSGYRFDKAHHPQEKLCWDLACKAYDFIEGTDVLAALEEVEQESE